MGEIFLPKETKLICGFIFSDRKYFVLAKSLLVKKFGEIDFESDDIPFNYTNYYQEEFGTGLIRKFVSFKKLINPNQLANVKIFTNRLEKKLSAGNKRRVNLDPGYVDLAKLVLATTKDFSHRIYLDKGIFAEVTLVFQNGTFTPFSWTYPDYASKEYIQIFNQIRGCRCF